MIESNRLLPLIKAMAVGTIIAELAAVSIEMAGETSGVQVKICAVDRHCLLGEALGIG
jgi:hypothetical protein